MQTITPFLWFHENAEEAVNFYVSLFEDAKIQRVVRYGEEGSRASGRPPGSIMTLEFQLAGQRFTAINGGSQFTFSPAISFVVNCETQEEVDYYWEKLSDGGDKRAQQCGWLQDKFGLSWQIVPTALGNLLSDPDPVKSRKVMQALLRMKKIDIGVLKHAHEEKS